MSEPATLVARDRRAGAGAPRPAERVYFPELDGLRFVAFLMVFLFHGGVPSARAQAGSSARPPPTCLRENGGYGVQLFFILSGYLIATLLLREEARYGRIALRAFWIRRILRIWPLYYLIVVIGFLPAARARGTVRDDRLSGDAADPPAAVPGASWATGRWP